MRIWRHVQLGGPIGCPTWRRNLKYAGVIRDAGRWIEVGIGPLAQQLRSANVVGVGSIGGHKLSVTRPNTFRIGPRNWQNMYFGITDLKAWGLAKPETAGEPVKGLLCQITLQIHGALIDIAHQKLWLRPEKPSR